MLLARKPSRVRLHLAAWAAGRVAQRLGLYTATRFRLPLPPCVAALLALLAMLCLAPARAGELTRDQLQSRFAPPWVLGERDASLPVWPLFEPFNGRLELRAHVFETVDLEAVNGYAGKPVNLLVVLDVDGSFRRVELLSHAEPLFRTPGGTARLGEFSRQYEGLTLQHDIQIHGPSARPSRNDSAAVLHGVMTGTVSVRAIDRAVLESAAQAALALAGGSRAAAAARSSLAGPDDVHRRAGWSALADLGLLQRWVLDNRRVQAAFADGEATFRDPGAMSWPDGKAVDLWLGFVGLPQLGRNLLDAAGWRQVRAAREAGRTLLMLLDSGRYPVAHRPSDGDHRAAVLALQQRGRHFALEPFAYQGGRRLSGTRSGVSRDAVMHLYAVQPAADGTPLDIEAPMTLRLALRRGSGGGASVVEAAFERPLVIPDAERYRPQREVPAWVAAWSQRGADLAVLVAALAVLTTLLLRQQWLSAQPRRLEALRLAWQVFTLGFIGWWAQGQLTVVTLTSALEATLAGRPLDFLLADPVAVVLWLFTGVTLLLWGRGTFCGWLCPFGALQELLSRIASATGFRSRRLSRTLDRRLKKVKYAVLALLLGAAAARLGWADLATEVEPFKTAISARFDREAPYLAWAAVVLAASVWVYRSFCRYLCPLGAALALVGRLRRWGWIPRRAECANPCQTCRHRCAYQAIDPSGAVQYDECFQCLDCVALHQDTRRCLPLLRAERWTPVRIVPAAAPRGERA